MLAEKLKSANSAELRLNFFFKAFVDMYLDNKGWFRLAWHEYIGGERPRRDIDVTETTNQMLNIYVSGIWNELTGSYPDPERTKRVLHNTHCYIVGEISNYLLGRGIIENETDLKAYITGESIRMFRLCLAGERYDWALI